MYSYFFHFKRNVNLSLTHLSDVEGCEADSEYDQHCCQQLDSPPSPLPGEIQRKVQTSAVTSHQPPASGAFNPL